MDIKNNISEDQQTVTIKLKAAPVKEGCWRCSGCFFEDGVDCNRMMCGPLERKDGMDIIWVKQ